MKHLHLTFLALTNALFASALLSCNNDQAPSESATAHSAQAQRASPAMPSGMPGSAGGKMAQLRAGCPMVVRGAEVTVTDTEGGVALAFTTDAADAADAASVAELRESVQRMAQMYEKHHGQAGRMWHHMGGKGIGNGGPGMGAMGDMGRGMGHMARRSPMPAVSTIVTDTDLGARLELRPTDPSQLDALREHVRWHQQRMHSGECWMLQDQPTAAPGGEQE